MLRHAPHARLRHVPDARERLLFETRDHLTKRATGGQHAAKTSLVERLQHRPHATRRPIKRAKFVQASENGDDVGVKGLGRREQHCATDYEGQH